MKKFNVLLLFLVLIWTLPLSGQDVKISDLPEATSLDADDLFVIVEDPSGSPATKKITRANIFADQVINVKDDPYNATGDGSTDDTAAVQAAIDADKHIYFPIGQYKITSTLTVTTTHTLEGAAASGTDTTSVSEILSTVEGAAISIAPASGKIYNCAIKNLSIKASGNATSSASAIGLKLTSSNYGYFENLSVQGFAAGYGIQATANNNAIGAANSFIGIFLYNNKYGINFTGYDATYADCASYIIGGAIIGADPVVSNSVGILVSQHSDGLSVFGTDVESFDYCIDIFGNDVRLLGARTEFQDTYAVRVDAGSSYTAIFAHKFSSGAVATHLSDSGTATMRTDTSSNVRLNADSLEFLNNIPIYMQESGGTARQILKLADNDTVQIGSSVNGNYPLGTWYLNSNTILSNIAFASLGTPSNGTVVYCTDCTKATPCAGSGSGALAKRINSVWDCD